MLAASGSVFCNKMAELDQVKVDDLHFTHLLDLIPAQFYFDDEAKQILRDKGDVESDSEEEEKAEPQQGVYCMM